MSRLVGPAIGDLTVVYSKLSLAVSRSAFAICRAAHPWSRAAGCIIHRLLRADDDHAGRSCLRKLHDHRQRIARVPGHQQDGATSRSAREDAQGRHCSSVDGGTIYPQTGKVDTKDSYRGSADRHHPDSSRVFKPRQRRCCRASSWGESRRRDDAGRRARSQGGDLAGAARAVRLRRRANSVAQVRPVRLDRELARQLDRRRASRPASGWWQTGQSSEAGSPGESRREARRSEIRAGPKQ